MKAIYDEPLISGDWFGARSSIEGWFDQELIGDLEPVVLENDYVSFTFEEDATHGLRLSSFRRVESGAHVWANDDPQLWRADVYDTTSAPSLTTAEILPTLVNRGDVRVTTDASGQQIVLRWTGIPVGTDFLDVVLTLRLNDTEDWLRGRFVASWNGVATKYALHEIKPIPLEVPLFNAPDDHAVACIGGGGIDCKNPGVNYRYNPGGGRPDTGFNLQLTNKWTFPAGRGWKMPLWGYYDEDSRESWMVYLEDLSSEIGFCTHESDSTGTKMIWEAGIPQPDHVLVNNNGQTLGSGYTFCLRPFLARQDAAWIDMGLHYKSRWERLRPLGFCYQRNNRSDLSENEKRLTIPIAIVADVTHTLGDGKPTNLLARIATMRANCGAPAGTRISGWVDSPGWRMQTPGEDPDGDLPSFVETLNETLDCDLALWYPGFGAGPYIWSIERWNQGRLDELELRETTTNDREGALRMSRSGYLEGGGTDRLAMNSLETGYYRRRTYPITAWDGGTKTLTVTGTPSADGFTGAVLAVLIPAGAGARLSRAVVQTLGAASVQVTGNFTDALGAIVTPDPTYTVAVIATQADGAGVTGDMSLCCPHALVNADTFMTRVENNSSVGQYDRWKSRGQYLDTWSEPLMQTSRDIRKWCYRDHTGWSMIDPGYVQHSLGGGSWMRLARRSYISRIRTSLRDALIADGKTPTSYIGVEDNDEGMQDLIDISFNTVSAGKLWRVPSAGGVSVDPVAKTIPLFQIVHAGRSFGRGLLREFSTGLGDPLFGDPELIAFQAYCLGVEWVYGWTLPTFSFYADDTIPIHNLFDNTIYVSGGGVISDDVKANRDYWVKIITAWTTWISPWMPFGEFMGIGVVDFAATDVTTGMARSYWEGNGNYHSYDTIYEHDAYPRVVHGVWKSRDDGSVLVVLSNWTNADAEWEADVDLALCGFPENGSVNIQDVDYDGTLGPITKTLYGRTVRLSATVPAKSVQAIICWRCRAPRSLPPS